MVVVCKKMGSLNMTVGTSLSVSNTLEHRTQKRMYLTWNMPPKSCMCRSFFIKNPQQTTLFWNKLNLFFYVEK